MEVLNILLADIGETILDMLMALLPIVLIFLVLQVTGLKLKKRLLKKIFGGFICVYVGLVFFMQGVHVAFLPIGDIIGEAIATSPYRWLLIPLGFIMGFLVAFAEPAVHVMIEQVEEISSGAIKARVMLIAISLGVAIAVCLAMVKILCGISLWWFLIPGYIIVFALAPFVDKTYVGIAFDNGGVATGPMCSTFILALSVAVASATPGADAQLDGFGVIALIALAPIITTMLLSFLYRTKKTEVPIDNSEDRV